MRLNRLAALAALTLLTNLAPAAPPADLPGSADHPLIKRFNGSWLAGRAWRTGTAPHCRPRPSCRRTTATSSRSC
jgi:hypothetical protein